MRDSTLLQLLRAIAADDAVATERLLTASPALSRARLERGATRQAATEFFLEELRHHVYAGDTALHVAAAAHRPVVTQRLLKLGADVRARNRRGAEPLHYAADGAPGSSFWDPTAQATTITCLIHGGADPNAVDLGGVTPLHRAVRTRCALAVAALLRGGADATRKNKGGSSPLQLATQTTGRSGSGSPEAKAQQQEILRLLTTQA